jgi:hypothetical protein
MKKEYIIIRPRLHPNFELPTREDLLKLKPGDSVKLMFQVDDDNVERMWVTLSDTSSEDNWMGIIDNDAIQDLTTRVLPVDKAVNFHPLDIIAIY